MEISFRPVTDEDDEFLFSVYASSRAEELVPVPWSDEQKRAFLMMQFRAQKVQYLERYPDANFQVILLDGEPVGRLYVARLPDQMRIIDIALLTEHRGKGTGEPIIRDLMKEAARAEKPVRIYVESFNRSRTLFERLGFAPVEEHLPYMLMEWKNKQGSGGAGEQRSGGAGET